MKMYRDMTPEERGQADDELLLTQQIQKMMAEINMAIYDDLPPEIRDLIKEGF